MPDERVLSPSRDSIIRTDDVRSIDRVLPPERTGLVSRTVSQFESGNNLISERYIQEARPPVSSRTVSNDYTETYEQTSERYLPPPRALTAERSNIERVLEVVSIPSSKIEDKTFGQAIESYFNPLTSSAGTGLNAGGGIGVIPGGEIQSGNSNTLLIFLVMGIGILAGYFYYTKVYKKGGNND